MFRSFVITSTLLLDTQVLFALRNALDAFLDTRFHSKLLLVSINSIVDDLSYPSVIVFYRYRFLILTA